MRRPAAVGSLGFAAVAAVLAVVLAIERFPRGIAVLALCCNAIEDFDDHVADLPKFVHAETARGPGR